MLRGSAIGPSAVGGLRQPVKVNWTVPLAEMLFGQDADWRTGACCPKWGQAVASRRFRLDRHGARK